MADFFVVEMSYLSYLYSDIFSYLIVYWLFYWSTNALLAGEISLDFYIISIATL